MRLLHLKLKPKSKMSKSKLRITIDDTEPRGLRKYSLKFKKMILDSVKTIKGKTFQEAGKLTTEQKAGKFFRSLFKWGKSAAQTIKKLPQTAKDLKYGAIFFAITVVLMLVLFLLVKIF